MLMGINLDEVHAFITEIDNVREKIRSNYSYRRGLLDQSQDYDDIKNYFLEFASFLQYSFEADFKTFYRVRRSKEGKPYSLTKDLKYPEPDLKHEDRMNNTSFRVLYTSFHEFTALAESRIDKDFIGNKFQLTRFSADKPLKVYKIGMFSEIYLNSPRDSELVKSKTAELFGAVNHDKTIQGYSALEVAMSNILYDQDKDYHILSSILADAIFSMNKSVEAIMYPSMQNRYGINFAFNKQSADALNISYTTMNRLTGANENGYFQYTTEMECTDFSDPELLIYEPVAEKTTYR